jgi:hypothetical protein
MDYFKRFESSMSNELFLIVRAFSVNGKGDTHLSRPPGFDFQHFLQLLGKHEILLSSFMVIDRLKGALLPEELQELQRLRLLFTKQQLKLSADLISLIKDFDNDQLIVLPLKGPVLSQNLYGDIGLRQSVDIDLLVNTADLKRSWHLLTRLNYTTPDFQPAHFSDKQWSVFMQVHNNLLFVSDHESATKVELHWKMFESEGLFYKYADKVLEDTCSLEVKGMSIKTLSPEDLMIYLCVHGAKHRWAGMKWLLDIRQFLIKYYDLIDWDAVLTNCYAHKIHRPVLQGLILSHGLFASPLPEAVNEYVRRDPYVEKIVRIALGHLSQLTFDDNNWSHTINIIKLKPGWKHTKFYINRLFYAPQDWSLLKLPDFLFFLYFPMRPFLMLYRKLSNRIMV